MTQVPGKVHEQPFERRMREKAEERVRQKAREWEEKKRREKNPVIEIVDSSGKPNPKLKKKFSKSVLRATIAIALMFGVSSLVYSGKVVNKAEVAESAVRAKLRADDKYRKGFIKHYKEKKEFKTNDEKQDYLFAELVDENKKYNNEILFFDGIEVKRIELDAIQKKIFELQSKFDIFSEQEQKVLKAVSQEVLDVFNLEYINLGSKEKAKYPSTYDYISKMSTSFLAFQLKRLDPKLYKKIYDLITQMPYEKISEITGQNKIEKARLNMWHLVFGFGFITSGVIGFYLGKRYLLYKIKKKKKELIQRKLEARKSDSLYRV